MKSFALVLFVLFFSVCKQTIAQTLSKAYGKVGKDDIELLTYAPDKEAEAIVLFDYGKSYFVDNDGSFDVIFERTTRIKIMSEAGLKWAEIEVPYYHEGYIYESVENVEGNTYNFADGQLKITKLDPSQSQVEKENENWNLKKFAMPDVKVGSIIEYKYKVNSQYVFNLRNWEFQWQIPCIYSEYETRMIPFFTYTWLLQGASKFSDQSSEETKGLERNFRGIKFNDLSHKYIMKDLPAFHDEGYITSMEDYIIKMDFQLSKIYYPDGTTKDIVTTWPKLIEDLLKSDDFGKYIKKSEKEAKEFLQADSLAVKNTSEKFEYVMNKVKSSFNWNQRRSYAASDKVSDFMKNKVGNCADINLFAIGQLSAAGIEAYPVILSTRDHGKIKVDYPFAHFFNYVIIMANIEGKVVMTDATEPLCQNDRIPTRCINDKGLVINNGDIQWVNLGCSFITSNQTFLNFNQFDSINHTFMVNMNIASTEYAALSLRNQYGDNIEKMKERINKDEGISLIDSTMKTMNYLESKKPYKMSYSVWANVEMINNKMYCAPFLREVINDNPFKQDSRNYPIDMVYPEKHVYITTLTIPKGYSVEYVPSNIKIANDQIDLDFSVLKSEDKINITFGYFFKKSVYPATDYAKIKYYYNEIVKKGNDKIVLVKQ
jgi:hypothetical protein